MIFLENLHVTNINALNPSIESGSAKIKSSISIKKRTGGNSIDDKDP